jgi:hypothetical protein
VQVSFSSSGDLVNVDLRFRGTLRILTRNELVARLNGLALPRRPFGRQYFDNCANDVAGLCLSPTEVDATQTHDFGVRTSGVAGIRTTVIARDPAKDGFYTIRLSVPANTKIQAHTHRDNRTAIVISGMWYFGYGQLAASAEEKASPAGSF